MIIYGASGHGKVIIEIAEANKQNVSAVWDDASIDSLLNYKVEKPFSNEVLPGEELIIAIGNNVTRKKVAEKIKGQIQFAKAVHSSTILTERNQIGKGTVVMAGVIINADVNIGKHCIINTAAVIEHDCRLGDYVHVSPNTTLCGNVSVGEGTHIGAGAVVIPGISIGEWCTIGAGTVVIRDIPDNSTVAGNPGRIIKSS